MGEREIIFARVSPGGDSATAGAVNWESGGW